LLKSNFAVATWMPSGVRRWVLRLGVKGCTPSAPEAPAGAGDPVQIAGVVPGTDDACWGDEHALTSATLVARNDSDSADMVAAAALRWPAGLGIARA
jgi:hypothetical protein